MVQEELKEKKIKDEEQRRSNDKLFCMDKTPPDRLDLTESLDHICVFYFFLTGYHINGSTQHFKSC